MPAVVAASNSSPEADEVLVIGHLRPESFRARVLCPHEAVSALEQATS